MTKIVIGKFKGEVKIKYMAGRIKFKSKTDKYTHTEFTPNKTLCGLYIERNVGGGPKNGEYLNRPTNCPECVKIIEFCKDRKSKEFERTVPINRPYTVPYSKIFNQLGIDGDLPHDEAMKRIRNFMDMQHKLKYGDVPSDGNSHGPW